jgi:hypothetical protein
MHVPGTVGFGHAALPRVPRWALRALRIVALSVAALTYLTLRDQSIAGTDTPDSYGLVVPEGFVVQVLGATDGRIAMPKNWFYTNRGTPSGWLWTFAAEDPAKGEYETGLRIQLFVSS